MSDRCFILGNSPELANINFKKLKHEKIFITNQGFKAKELGLTHYDFYVISDPREVEKSQKEINKNVKCLKFISSIILKKYNKDILSSPYFYFNREPGVIKEFPSNFNEGWGKVFTVVYDAAIIAYFLGFKEIYFLGVSFDYSSSHHFYKEIKIEEKNLLSDNFNQIIKASDIINSFFEKNNIKFFNCTKNWKYTNLIKYKSLSEVIK